MRKFLVPILLSLGTYASAAFLPSTSTLVNQGYPGTNDWPVRVGTTSVNQGTAGTSYWNVDHSTGVQVNTGTKFLSVELTTGVPQGKAGASFWPIELSTGVKANQGTPAAAFWGVELTTGVKANQGTGAAAYWGVELTTGVKANQGTAGTSFWNIDHSTGVQVNGGGAKGIAVELSTGAQVNTGAKFLSVELTTGVPQGKAGTSNWGVDYTTGVQVNGGGTKNIGVELSTGVASKQSGIYQVEPGTGNFRVSIVAGAAAGGTSSNFGTTVPTAGTAAGFVGAGGNMAGAQVDASSSVYVRTGNVFVSVEASTGIPIVTPTKFIGVDHSTGVQVNTGGKFLSVEATSGVYVVGGAASGATIAGNPLAFGVDAASSTVPTGVANGKIIYTMSDSFGRQAITGMPYGVIFSTYMVQVSSSIYGVKDQKDAVLVSSAGTNLYTYLCGCTFTNTTATNGKITIASPVNASANSTSYAVGTIEQHFMTIGVPANYITTGLWPGCSQPFFRSALNTSISIIQNVATSVQNIEVNCNYFVGQ